MNALRHAHNGHCLAAEIVTRSVGTTWEQAKREWVLADVYIDRDSPGVCLCGHVGIVQHCVLRNRHTGVRVLVGNVCVKRFLGLPSDKIFAALNRVALDAGRALNEETISFARSRGWIDDWEDRFYSNTLRQSRLSPRQQAKRREVNRKVVARAMWGASPGVRQLDPL